MTYLEEYKSKTTADSTLDEVVQVICDINAKIIDKHGDSASLMEDVVEFAAFCIEYLLPECEADAVFDCFDDRFSYNFTREEVVKRFINIWDGKLPPFIEQYLEIMGFEDLIMMG